MGERASVWSVDQRGPVSNFGQWGVFVILEKNVIILPCLRLAMAAVLENPRPKEV